LRSGGTEALRSNRPLAAVVAALLVLVVAVVAALAGGSGEPPPATGAAAIVPGNALAYVHLSTDPSRPAVKRALALARLFPDYFLASAAVTTRLGAIAGGSGSVDFAHDIRPWLGKEAAFALLNTTTSTAGSLIVLDVTDQGRASAFLNRSGASTAGAYGGVALLRYQSGTELAFVGHYLALGQDASVRAAIDVAAGRTASLQSDAAYRAAAAGEPADRVLDAYASLAGVRRLLAPQHGPLGALGVLLFKPSLTGATISVSALARGAQVRVHSALDPALARLTGTGKTAFTPTLQNVIPAGSTLMLDVTGLDQVAPRVLDAGAAGGVAGRIGPLLRRLGAALVSEGVNVPAIVSIFRGETAVAIAPATRTKSRAPTLVIVARTQDEAATRTALAALELPLEQLFPAPSSGPGQAPLFNDRQIAGVTAHQLSLAPGLEFDYAVFNGLVVISTSLNGIAGVAARAHPIANDSSFKSTLANRPDRVTSLLFLDFSQLLSLGEQTGLTRSARYRAIRADLEKVRAVGLDSTSGEADTTAELFLQIL
jgi:hypothetical protein